MPAFPEYPSPRTPAPTPRTTTIVDLQAGTAPRTNPRAQLEHVPSPGEGPPPGTPRSERASLVPPTHGEGRPWHPCMGLGGVGSVIAIRLQGYHMQTVHRWQTEASSVSRVLSAIGGPSVEYRDGYYEAAS